MLSTDRLLPVLWDRKWTFLATFVVTLAAAAAVTASLEKVYEATAYLYVSAGGSSPSTFDQVQANQVAITTLSELLQTRKVASAAAQRLQYGQDDVELQKRIEVAPVQQSQLITVTASAPDAQRAQRTANVYAGTFVALQGELVGSSAGASRVQVAASAPLPDDPSRPKPKLYLLVGAFVALLVAAGVAVLRDRTDKRLRLDPSATELEGVSIIGQVPRVTSASISSSVKEGGRPTGARQLDEAYRLVLANLAFANGGARPRTLAVVSSGRSEGKSTASMSLALAAAELGIDVLLVDGDMRRPRVGALVGPPAESVADLGLSSVLREDGPSLRSALEDVPGTSLSVLRTGPLPPNPAGLLAGRRLAEFIARAAEEFDLVIVDTPPLTVGADASLIAAETGGTVLVVDGQSASRTDVHRAIDQLRRARANLLGVVVNRAEGVHSEGYYEADGPSGAVFRRGGRGREGTAAIAAPAPAETAPKASAKTPPKTPAKPSGPRAGGVKGGSGGPGGSGGGGRRGSARSGRTGR